MTKLSSVEHLMKATSSMYEDRNDGKWGVTVKGSLACGIVMHLFSCEVRWSVEAVIQRAFLHMWMKFGCAAIVNLGSPAFKWLLISALAGSTM